MIIVFFDNKNLELWSQQKEFLLNCEDSECVLTKPGVQGGRCGGGASSPGPGAGEQWQADGPAPADGGADCEDEADETSTCDAGACPCQFFIHPIYLLFKLL